MSVKTIGVLGGLGPAASCYFYSLLTALCPAARDQGHPDILLYSKASVPDRSAFLLGEGPSPLPALEEGIRLLTAAGAQALALPCATAHHFYAQLQAAAGGVPVLNMLALTAQALAGRGVARAALLATAGTYRSGAFCAALEREGVAPLLPGPEGQAALTALIYSIKAGRQPGAEQLEAVAAPLLERGAQRVILGCTELSLLRGLDAVYIDPMRLLAERLIGWACGGEAL